MVSSSLHPDDDLLRLARAGGDDQRRAASAALRRHLRDLYHHVRARLPEDEAAVQDVLQEVALAVVEGLSRVRDGATLRPWMLQVASNKVCDHLRRTRRTRARLDATLGDAALEHLEDPNGSIEALLERAGEAQLAAYLRRAVDHLSEHQRRAVELVYFEGVGADEAAARLGLRPDALASLLYRARKAFLKQLERDRAAGNPIARRSTTGGHGGDEPARAGDAPSALGSGTGRLREVAPTRAAGVVPASAWARK